MMIDPELKLNEPFTLSIEPSNGPVRLHPYHLGTDGAIARDFARMIWARVNRAEGCQTVALMRDGKLYDTWDGMAWQSVIINRAFGDLNLEDTK